MIKRFPNKNVSHTYEKARGRTFTWSPTYQRFTDESGSSDYNYHAMMWLKDNGWLDELPWTGSLVSKFLMKT